MVQVQFAGSSACGGETRVVAATRVIDHCDVVGTTQVVTKRFGARVGPVVIGARQQIIDQVAAQTQLQLCQVSFMGKFESQDGAGELEGKHLIIIGLLVRIDE